MDAPVEEPIVAPEPAAPEPAPTPQDPFSLDEARLASLSPEQRAALDPVFDEWKSKAKAELEKSGKTYEAKYKPHMEKAQALDELVKDTRFQGWWRSVQQSAAAQNPAGAQAAAEAKPQDFATPNEWNEAWANAYQGDYTKFKDIQARMFAVMATPVINQLQEGQRELKQTLEMKALFENHADAKELDVIGRDLANPEDKSKSLLQFALEWADNNKRPLEEGYQLAKRWADSLRVKSDQQAMGLVNGKKASVTSGPSTNQPGPAVVEVEDMDELMAKTMDYMGSNQKPPKFVVKKQEAPSGARWAQR